jgi:hypothetical protein
MADSESDHALCVDKGIIENGTTETNTDKLHDEKGESVEMRIIFGGTMAGYRGIENIYATLSVAHREIIVRPSHPINVRKKLARSLKSK